MPCGRCSGRRLTICSRTMGSMFPNNRSRPDSPLTKDRMSPICTMPMQRHWPTWSVSDACCFTSVNWPRIQSVDNTAFVADIQNSWNPAVSLHQATGIFQHRKWRLFFYFVTKNPIFVHYHITVSSGWIMSIQYGENGCRRVQAARPAPPPRKAAAVLCRHVITHCLSWHRQQLKNPIRRAYFWINIWKFGKIVYTQELTRRDTANHLICKELADFFHLPQAIFSRKPLRHKPSHRRRVAAWRRLSYIPGTVSRTSMLCPQVSGAFCIR